MPIELAHHLHGPEGAPVAVLLHGMGAASDHTSWDAVVPLLASDFQLVVVDLRGHGASPWPGSYTLAEQADDVARLLDGLGVTRATVIGHSMGGRVALALAMTRPELVEALVVEDSPPPPCEAAPNLDTSPPQRPEGPLPYDNDVRPAIMREFNRPEPEWERRLGEIAVPTLVIGGGSANSVDQHGLAAIAKAIPAGTWATIDAGHNIHVDRPEEFVALVREWMN